MNTNKKRMNLLFIFILLFAAGCSSSTSSSKELEPFVGEWDCGESQLEDEDMYTGYYRLRVSKNGEFSIYDGEAGNPGISGKMSIDSDTELTVKCSDEDFDPPSSWFDMSENQTLEYEFISDDELHLIYSDNGDLATLVFYKSE